MLYIYIHIGAMHGSQVGVCLDKELGHAFYCPSLIHLTLYVAVMRQSLDSCRPGQDAEVPLLKVSRQRP